jgi:hypothetical protein
MKNQRTTHALNLFSSPIRRLAFHIKYFVFMGIMILTLSGCQKDEAGPKPSTAEVEPALKTFLTAQEAAKENSLGSGSVKVEVDQLSVTSVGDFSKEMGGWPVYTSAFEVTRHQGVSTVTEKHPSNSTAAEAFARRTATGTIECFMPEVFQQAEKNMNSAMQKALDNIQIKK